jgi:hypothetical protein
VPGWLARLVARIAAMAADGRVQLTAKASLEADDLGLSQEDVNDVLMSLKTADYAGRLTSHGEWLYVFLPEVEGLLLYVKLVVRAGCVIVSFHEDKNQDEDEVAH